MKIPGQVSAQINRLVIDSNRMQSQELRVFLEASPANMAVIPDYGAIEAFKGRPMVSIKASWAVLRDFPDQILILKGTRIAGTIDPRAPGMGNCLIDRSETRAARRFAQRLDEAGEGNLAVRRQLEQRERWARDQMNGMAETAIDMAEVMAAFAAQFTPAEKKRFGSGEVWKDETALKFLGLVHEMALRSFADHPDKPSEPGPRHLVNHFLYRHALAYMVYNLELMTRGGRRRAPDKALNDTVDVILATYATYFNGFMSGDELGTTVHAKTRFLLLQMEARVAEDYAVGYKAVIDEEVARRQQAIPAAPQP